MGKLEVTAGALALAAAAFFAGRATGPSPALAEEKEKGGAGHHGQLDRPHDVSARLVIEGKESDFRVASAVTFAVDAAGQSRFLRLTNKSGKMFYLNLDKVLWVEATPEGK